MNPFLHAVLAGTYIVSIVFAIQTVSSLVPKEDGIFAPMVFLGLLVLSVAVMGFLFGYKPLSLYLDGHRKEALAFFGQTVGAFAIIVAIFIGFLLFSS